MFCACRKQRLTCIGVTPRAPKPPRAAQNTLTHDIESLEFRAYSRPPATDDDDDTRCFMHLQNVHTHVVMLCVFFSLSVVPSGFCDVVWQTARSSQHWLRMCGAPPNASRNHASGMLCNPAQSQLRAAQLMAEATATVRGGVPHRSPECAVRCVCVEHVQLACECMLRCWRCIRFYARARVIIEPGHICSSTERGMWHECGTDAAEKSVWTEPTES